MAIKGREATRRMSRVRESASESRVSTAVAPVTFRFNRDTHTYTLNDEEVPHITEMLECTGYIDTEWFTAKGQDRGTMVHRLTADYDLGAITDPRSVECIYKGWFLAHVSAMRNIKPVWKHVETAMVSQKYRFGGRPDRVGKVWGAWAVVDLKTGQKHTATPIQLALHAILAAPELHLPPTAIVRYELDLKETGKFGLYEHTSRNDFDKAYEVIDACCKSR